MMAWGFRMFQKVMMQIVILWLLAASMVTAIQMNSEGLTTPPTQRHQESKRLLAAILKINSQIDCIVYLMSSSILETNEAIESIETRLNEVEREAQVHGVLLLIDRSKLKALRETLLYYRSIVNNKNLYEN